MSDHAVFKCFNCRREKLPEEAASLSWPARIGWIVLGGGIVGGVCRDCKAGVTFIGSAVTLFFVVVGVMWLLYAIGGVFN
jgi:hypothetical protein